ncbi:MAG: MATE family efflux transporter [Saprospiraceae bacterium]|nr:MATE family efflux transporter [Bacteroidia bacterium]NNE15624.1 MATE family efflux transporter [Saprospiraceae bacterium]NNL93548.1 MATE family efflux transporter [Saprospiraceae bacterium]
MTLDKEIFKISIPNIVSNISIPLLGIVDTALMGRMNDPAYIGAIAIGGIIFNILYWGFGFLRPGTTGLTAQAFGKNDDNEIYSLLYRGLIIGVIISGILLLLHSFLDGLFFSILDGSQKVKGLASEYFHIRIWAAPAVLCLFSFRGWFFGVQNAIAPMVLTIVANILNIFFSWYFVIILEKGVAGVAYGTLIAQWLTLVLAMIIFIYRHRSKARKYFNRGVFKAQELKRFLIINRDMFIRNMGLILVFSYFTNHSSKLGDAYLATNQMLLELFYLMSYTVDGFAYASESLVGKYLGAGQIKVVKKVIKKCLIYGLALGCVFALSYTFYGQQLLRVLTTNQDLINDSQPYFIWLALVGLAGALAFVWDGVYSGATASVELRNSMLISVVAFFAVFYSLNNAYPLYSVWAGMIAFMLSRSVFQMILFNKSIIARWEQTT